MQFLKKHAITILYVVITMALAFLGYRLFSESAKVSDIMLFAFFSSGLLSMPLVEVGDKILKKLRELEPKTGAGPCSVSPVDSRSHRHDLERALANTLAPYLVNSHTAQKMGAYIRGVVDAMIGAGQSTIGQAVAMAAIQPHVDALAKVAGLAGPSVTGDQIQALMGKLTWRYEQPDGTTSTFAHAFLGSFYLVTGHSACVSPENFDAAKGMKYAREQAEGKARDKLWELEGWALHSRLSNIRNNSDEPIPA